MIHHEDRKISHKFPCLTLLERTIYLFFFFGAEKELYIIVHLSHLVLISFKLYRLSAYLIHMFKYIFLVFK